MPHLPGLVPQAGVDCVSGVFNNPLAAQYRALKIQRGGWGCP